MENVFKNTDEKKRDAIINAALDEFSANRYEKASTNNIVKNAGISKGLLYHYFKNKKELYDYLEIFSITTIANAVLDEIDWSESDFFKRIEYVVLTKIRILDKYPKITSFSKVMYEKKTVDELKKFVEIHVPDMNKKIYHEGIDFSLFKENVDVARVIKMTQWIFEKMGEEASLSFQQNDTEVMADLDGLKNEIFAYTKMLKEAFYK